MKKGAEVREDILPLRQGTPPALPFLCAAIQ